MLRNKENNNVGRTGEYSLFTPKRMKFGVYVDFDLSVNYVGEILFGSWIQLKNLDSSKL